MIANKAITLVKIKTQKLNENNFFASSSLLLATIATSNFAAEKTVMNEAIAVNTDR